MIEDQRVVIGCWSIVSCPLFVFFGSCNYWQPPTNNRQGSEGDILQRTVGNYDQLPEEIRSKLPLRRVWMLAD